MKKITTLLLLLVVSLSQAQLPVSHNAENKNVILEEFTGIHCGYCPDGHRIAQLVHDAHPNDVVLINIHTGSFATPGADEPDFRTSFGNALASQSQLTGFPAGTINRHAFGHSQSGAAGATALSRSTWQSDANTILGQSAYLNVASEATIDIQTRVMTINVEVYYTGNSPQSQNSLNVVLLQNNVEGPQSGSSANPSQVLPNGNYNHMHMLRHMITGQWGDPITTTTQGTLIQRQYTYTLPADINGVDLNLGDLEIAAFVSETHQEIISGSVGSISYSGMQYTTNAGVLEVTYNDNICNSNDLDAKVKVTNSGSDAITAMTIEYNVNSGATQTLNWTGNLNSLGTKVIDLPNFSFSVEPTNTLNVNIVSVNGSTDENTGDNTNTVNFNETGNNGTGTNYVVTIVQDQYGSESTWVITDSAGNVITYGGPYSNLPSPGTQTHTHNVTLSNNDCYTFHMLDSYGDGMNGGFGAGNYKMEQADGTLVLQGDGVFGSEDAKYFSVDGASGINESAFDGVKITPNPSEGIFTFENVADTDIIIYNSLGEQVYAYHKAPVRLNLNLSFLSNGVYFAHLQKNDKFGVKKIIINH